jgi:excisionase family DNA binding protein
MKRVLTIKEAAAILKVSPNWLNKQLRRGAIPGFRVGGNWRIDAGALDDCMREQTLIAAK